MINFDALDKANITNSYIIKEAPNIMLWNVGPCDGKPYYVIIQTINEDNSITIIIASNLRNAIRTFNKMKMREKL
jgi:hypothetical protein